HFRIDQPLVFALKSQTEAGWYGAAYKPIEALLFIPMTFLSVVFPVLSVYHRERQTEVLDALNRFYKALLLMGWPMSVGIFVLASAQRGHEALRTFRPGPADPRARAWIRVREQRIHWRPERQRPPALLHVGRGLEPGRQRGPESGSHPYVRLSRRKLGDRAD